VSRSHTTYQKRGITVQGEEKGEGVDFFLLSKLPFGSASGGETAGATKDSGATSLAAASGVGARTRVAPVHDLVGTADWVQAEAPHQAKRGVATLVHHGDRTGIGRFEGHDLGEEQREPCEEEDTIGTLGRASNTNARRRRHGLTSGDGWWRRGLGSAICQRTYAFLFSAFAQCHAGGEAREEERVSGGGGGGGRRRGDGARVGGGGGGRRIGLEHGLSIALTHGVSRGHQHWVIERSGSGLR
jgi:hypothetical protein